MGSPLRLRADPVGEYFDDRFVRWRMGTREGQLAAFAFLFLGTAMLFVLSLWNYGVIPSTPFILPILLGGLMLRYRPLVLLTIICLTLAVISGTIESVRSGEITSVRVTSFIVLFLSSGIFLFIARRNRSGLPGPLGELMLMELRDRLQMQGTVPTLPAGWTSSTAMLSAGGTQFAGDFLVAVKSDDGEQLEMILVDVCGKGVSAGTQSLQFAGALGGLIGSLPQDGLFAAANDYLLRQHWEDGFATAVHVVVNLTSGKYSIISAGHPPALRWDSVDAEWKVDGARGVALGIMPRPDFSVSTGYLEPGEALLFYTDGVTEQHSHDPDEGLAWLKGVAREAAREGLAELPRRITTQVHSVDDDSAVLILARN